MKKHKYGKIILLVLLVALSFFAGYSIGFADAVNTLIDTAFKVLNINASDIVFSDYGKVLLKEYIAKGGLG
jgi:hypothetical protein